MIRFINGDVYCDLPKESYGTPIVDHTTQAILARPSTGGGKRGTVSLLYGACAMLHVQIGRKECPTSVPRIKLGHVVDGMEELKEMEEMEELATSFGELEDSLCVIWWQCK